MKKLISNLKINLLEKEDFSDCVFLVENIKIYAHKALLVA
jgi:hypothetical protein